MKSTRVPHLIFALLTILTANSVLAQDIVISSPEEAASNAMFQLQGEYVGESRSAQVVALGDSEYELVVYAGGLPGAGWDRSPPRRLTIEGDQVEEFIEANGLKKTVRKSPTLGAEPPAGAVVLFDGSSESLKQHWDAKANMTKGGLLTEGATSTDLFQSYTLHLEFRTPFMPNARGQKRGNSGVYHQGRYETQVLDSFGLEGKMDEAGGIYTVRDPDLNMCFPPLTWQTYDIDFAAAQFDANGKKIQDGLLTVKLNGVLVQQNVPLPHNTRAAPLAEGPDAGPIYIQNHGDPVRFRNIWVKPRDLAKEARRPRLPGFERFFASNTATSDKTEGHAALGGQLLISELGCTNCHSMEQDLELSVKQAPILTAVGSRIQSNYLVEYLANPHQLKPGTTMPDLLSSRTDEERIEIASALTSFLMTTGQTVERFGDPRAVASGEQLFHSIGCTACHEPQNTISENGNIQSLATSVPLGDLDSKYTLVSLSGFLQKPHAVRPSGRMPNFNLDDQQSSDIATYLLRESVIGQGALNVEATFYEGDWENLPDFNTLTPYLETKTYGLDIAASGKTQSFAAKFETIFVAPKNSNYKFYLGSDDGSRLFIDGKQVLDRDGIHPFSMGSTQLKLDAGEHAIRVDYFERSGEEVLRMEVEGGGLPRTDIATVATLTPGEDTEPESSTDAFVGSPQLTEKGRGLFSSLGCAACHELESNGKALANSLQAKPLLSLDLSNGCIADQPPKGVPNYDLTATQQSAIRETIQSWKSTKTPLEDFDRVHLTMATMNCYACHSRDQIGGPELARDAAFQTTMKEMGDEGRLPPWLTGVGDKLKETTIRDTLANGANERPYMLVNMPGFGAETLKRLAADFSKMDQRTEADIPELDEPLPTTKSAGRVLVGSKGLSCVKCHVFDGKGAPGIQAIDMSRMASRLREDWFHRYLMSPTTYRPGTRMPASFPDGESVLPDLYHGDPDTQIHAMWAYLSDGKDAREPIGIQAQLIELVAEERPVIYRNFIAGLTPRGIGVGYPEGANLAWDANSMALVTVWKGAFIDASKHWVGRGPGDQVPLGDEVVKFESSVPFAALSEIDSPWPTTAPRERGFKFRGYRLNASGQPTFQYRNGERVFAETTVPVVGDNSFELLKREFEIDGRGANGSMVFRAAAGKKIEPADDGWFKIDERLMVKTNLPVEVVKVPNGMELRGFIPNDSDTIEQLIRW